MAKRKSSSKSSDQGMRHLAEAEKALNRADKLQRENQAQLNKLVAEQRAERALREEMDNLPPEVILRARELDKKKKFHRAVAKRVPRDVARDTLHLECGHTHSVFHPDSGNEPRRCSECLDRWLLRESRKLKKKKGAA